MKENDIILLFDNFSDQYINRIRLMTFDGFKKSIDHFSKENLITIPQVEDYGNYCIECDRKGIKPLKYNDYLKF